MRLVAFPVLGLVRLLNSTSISEAMGRFSVAATLGSFFSAAFSSSRSRLVGLEFKSSFLQFFKRIPILARN
jgi:hypothetical protein